MRLVGIARRGRPTEPSSKLLSTSTSIFSGSVKIVDIRKKSIKKRKFLCLDLRKDKSKLKEAMSANCSIVFLIKEVLSRGRNFMIFGRMLLKGYSKFDQNSSLQLIDKYLQKSLPLATAKSRADNFC